MTMTNPIADAQGWIVANLRDGRGSDFSGYCEECRALDRGARIMQALLAENAALRQEVCDSHAAEYPHRGSAGWWVKCTCGDRMLITEVPVDQTEEPTLADQIAAIGRHVEELLSDCRMPDSTEETQ